MSVYVYIKQLQAPQSCVALLPFTTMTYVPGGEAERENREESGRKVRERDRGRYGESRGCLLYTSDAADDTPC
eukprot:3075328-Pleurochrysis_carterae.AAC.3